MDEFRALRRLVDTVLTGPVVAEVKQVEDLHFGPMDICTLTFAGGHEICSGPTDMEKEFELIATALNALPRLLWVGESASRFASRMSREINRPMFDDPVELTEGQEPPSATLERLRSDER